MLDKTARFCDPPRIMKTRTLQLRNSVSRSHLRLAFLLIPLACFALSPSARAVDPPPDGGYPNANTAEGDSALFSLTSGGYNTAIGALALNFNTTGNNNTATGAYALFSNTDGGYNTATGLSALTGNTTGNNNTASGFATLASNTIGSDNTANGAGALNFNTTGSDNTANGFAALASNTIGSDNTA